MKKSILSLSLSLKSQSKLKRRFNIGNLFNYLKSTFPSHSIINSPYGEPKSTTYSRGFTIVELLVVIVVIGILAAITIVSYTGISSKATVASLQSDLASAKNQLQMYYTEYGYYPTVPLTNNCPTAPSIVDNRYCLKPSGSNTFTYSTLGVTTNPQSFALQSSNGSGTTKYIINNNSSPAIISASPTLTCPTGFIPVPGSITYGTADFCVMKYEAKNAGSNVPVSTAAGTPFVSVNQTNAAIYSQNVAGCTGCHLITEAEWMTIAQNVLSVASNWDNGAGVHAVGTGYIYSGHNDNVPANALAAAADNDPYNGTGQVSPSNQKRTLTLSNGEVIWDLAGNVWEWTSATTTGGQPGITGTGGNWRQWNVVSNSGTISPNPSATATGIANANNWTSAYGIGQIWSNTEETGLRGFLRGGSWNSGDPAGVLALDLGYAPSTASADVGFRVAAP